MSADVLEEAVGPFVAYAATAKAPVPIKSRCVCVSLASEMPKPNPLQAPKTFADVQSGFVALIVVVDCVRPPRRRTLWRRRDLVIIQAALRAVHALQAELVTEGLVRRAGTATSRIVLRELFWLLHRVIFPARAPQFTSRT